VVELGWQGSKKKYFEFQSPKLKNTRQIKPNALVAYDLKSWRLFNYAHAFTNAVYQSFREAHSGLAGKKKGAAIFSGPNNALGNITF
jgi:hypothetical protein